MKRTTGIIKFLQANNFKTYTVSTTVDFDEINYSVISKAFKTVKRILKILKILFTHKFNTAIVFGTSPGSGNWLSFIEKMLFSFIIKLFGIRIIYLFTGGRNTERKKGQKFTIIIGRFFLSLVNYVGVQGENWRVFTEKMKSSSNVFIIRNWHEVKDFSLEKKEKNSLVKFIFVGWLIKAKGVDEILFAIKELSSKYNFEISFIGDGPEFKKINSFKRQLSDNVIINLLGWQDKNGVEKYLAMSDIFILPSYTEGFPNALVEALCFGLPSICSDVGSISDSVINDYNGFLIQPGSEVELCKAMEYYLMNRDKIEIQSKNALKVFKTNHDYDVNCSQLLKFI